MDNSTIMYRKLSRVFLFKKERHDKSKKEKKRERDVGWNREGQCQRVYTQRGPGSAKGTLPVV